MDETIRRKALSALDALIGGNDIAIVHKLTRTGQRPETYAGADFGGQDKKLKP